MQFLFGVDKDEGRFLTAHGLASESLKSRYYDPDGYWRGPIWAPSTWLLVYGLRDCGETVFADRLARAFCDICADHGFAENFDAITGDGLVGCGFATPKQDKQHGFVVGIL